MSLSKKSTFIYIKKINWKKQRSNTIFCAGSKCFLKRPFLMIFVLFIWVLCAPSPIRAETQCANTKSIISAFSPTIATPDHSILLYISKCIRERLTSIAHLLCTGLFVPLPVYRHKTSFYWPCLSFEHRNSSPQTPHVVLCHQAHSRKCTVAQPSAPTTGRMADGYGCIPVPRAVKNALK